MITKDIIERVGLTPNDLKAKFTAKKPSDKIKKLIQLTRDRIDEGRRINLRDYRMWWAMDIAYEAPFRNISQTIFNQFISTALKGGDMSSSANIKAAEDWGLAAWVTDSYDSDGKRCKKIDLPVFNKIVVPLCRAYLNMRVARIFSQHDTYPLLKYEPVRSTQDNRARCEIITDIVECQGSQLGYRETLKQWIINAMLYGTSIKFPIEDWFRDFDVEIDSKGKQVKVLKRCGLRYHMPHPSRVFWDRSFRISTINSDSGCTFAGFWRVARYGDIKSNKAYWNKDMVSMFSNDLFANNQIFFSNVYPCTMEFPSTGTNTAAGHGAGPMDRESTVSFYTTSDVDKAVFLTDVYQKLVPKDWDLGDLDVPVWFRFVMANDDDVIYCAPICYTPACYMGYDAHEERVRNASLVLEVIPYQDHISNLLTQQILSAKNNLMKAVFVNKDLVEPQYLDALANKGEDLYRTMNFIPYSGRKSQMIQQDIRSAFTPVQFPIMNTVELVGAMRMLLDVLERILVFSAQEVGAPASHEQTAEEVRLIGGSVTTRVDFTDSYVRDAIVAWKRQLYEANMAYGPKTIYAQVYSGSAITDADLKRLGFTYDVEPVPGVSNGIAKGPTTGVRLPAHLEGFASSRDGMDRINNAEVAASMAQITQVLMANPITAQAIGAQQAIDIYNAIAKVAGLPRDFKLKVANPAAIKNMEDQAAGLPTNGLPSGPELQQILQQLTQEVLAKAGEQAVQVAEKITQPITAALGNVVKQTQATQSQIPALQKSVESIMSRFAQIVGAAQTNASGTTSAGSGS